jgi:hypothetical protein
MGESAEQLKHSGQETMTTDSSALEKAKHAAQEASTTVQNRIGACISGRMHMHLA